MRSRGHGVEDILFISMDGVSGLEEDAKSIFKDVVVQRCIVHLVRNSIKYIPSKDYKVYTTQLKRLYGAPSLQEAQVRQAWSHYPGAIGVWGRDWAHVEQLFQYGSVVRKVIYTTNSIEALNSSLRKATKRGAFPSENAVLKALYLRLAELYKKWKVRPVPNRAMVRNQLSVDDGIQARIMKYEKVQAKSPHSRKIPLSVRGSPTLFMRYFPSSSTLANIFYTLSLTKPTF